MLILVPLLGSFHWLGYFRWFHGSFGYWIPSHPFATFFMIASVVSIGPYVEEVFFRGLLMERISLVWNPTAGIIVTSLIFGLGHAAPINAFVFGVVMCLLYIKTGSLLVPIAVHSLNNCIATILSLTMHNTNSLGETASNFMANPWVNGASIAVLCATAFLLWPRKGTRLPLFFRDATPGDAFQRP